MPIFFHCLPHAMRFISPITPATVLLLSFGFFTGFTLQAQCPTLNANATLTSPDCTSGNTPCDVCPGDVITLNATGMGLQPGVCINWFYGTTNNFNPYNGEGTLLGCSEIAPLPPNPCGECPMIGAIFVDACGTEENNEYIALFSGSGFYVDDAMLDIDAANNAGSGNEDIGSGCGWQFPSGGAINSIQTLCPGATVVGAGPGDVVPEGVAVIVFTSSELDYNYNFGSLCPVAPVIYVMQNGCARSSGAFTNGGGGGTCTTTFSLSCGCTWTTTYNVGSLTGGNGAFVTDFGFPPFYGNAGCGFPPVPGGGGGGGGNPPIIIPPYDVTITQDMCNGGPYWIVGIIEPLPAGCPQTSTNYLPFDVPCPEPTLSTAEVCEDDPNFNLNQIGDPAVPSGSWAGPGVTGTMFDPSGLSGDVTLTFTPNGPCSVPANTTISVYPTPTAQFEPVTPACAGSPVDLVINFTGQAPWSFNLFAGGLLVTDYETIDNPFTITVAPNTPTNYSIQNFKNDLCSGSNVSIFVTVITAPSAVLTYSGNDTICRGQQAIFSVSVNGAPPPFSFVYAINSINQPIQNATSNPFFFNATPDTTAFVSLVNVNASGCQATVSGNAQVAVRPAPVAMIASDTLQVCQGQLVDLFVHFSGAPGPYTYIYTVNSIPSDTITTSFATDTLSFMPVSGNYLYALDSVGAGVCPGIVIGQFLFQVVQSITASISGNDTLCGPGGVDLTVDFTGTGPFTFVYAIDGIAQPSVTTSNNPYLLTVSPTATSLYTLLSVEAPGCTGTVSGQAEVIVQPGASGVLSGGGVTCTGGTGSTITITFSGPGPYTYVYSADNVDEPPATTSNTVVVIPVNPSNGTFYRLESVSNGACDGQATGGVWVFVFTPPTADLTGDATICNGVDTSLTIDFTGTGPFTIVYSIDGVLQAPDSTFDDPYFIPVNISSTTEYALISVESPGCSGIPIGDATITINYPPQVTNVNILCNNNDITYQVEFDLQGQAPFTITGLTGTIDASNHFVSDPIPQAMLYNVMVGDANGCDEVPLTGISVCNCTSSAGTMSQVLETTCDGLPVTATFNNDGVLDANDVLQYVLHTGSGATLGTVLAVGPTAQFAFIPGVTLSGTTYYVSAVVGNNNGSGSVDLNDPCLSVAVGGPVRWVPAPTASLSGMFDVCPNEPQVLGVTFTGQAPYSLTYTNNGSPVSIISNQNNFNIIVTLQQSSAFVLTSVQDQNCTGTVSGQATVTVHPAPLIGNIQVLCDPTGQNYTLSFDVVAGDQATAVVGGLAGVYNPTNGTFLSTLVPVANPYNVTLADFWQCGQDDASGVALCNCTTAAGTITSAPQQTCIEDIIGLPASTGSFLDFDDGLVYLLVTTQDPSTWTILQQTAIPVFSFLPVIMTPGQTYFVVAIAGNASGPGVDSNDPCLSISNAVNVLWQIPPSAVLSGNATICTGETAQLSVQFAGGAAPYAFVINDGTTNLSFTTSQNPYILGVLPTAPISMYSLVSFADGNGCDGTISGNAQVTIAASPTATINFDTTLCQGSNAVFPIVFTGTPPYQLVYAVNGNPQPVLVVPQNTFTIIVSNIQSDQTYTLVSVQDAVCTGTVGGSGTIQLQEPASIDLTPAGQDICSGDSAYVTLQLEGGSYFMVILSDGLNQFVFDSVTNGAVIAFASNQMNTTYSVTGFSAYGNPCPGNIGPGVSVQVSFLQVTASLSDYNGFNVGCNGDSNGSIQLAIDGGITPYQILWSQGGTGTTAGNLNAGMYSATVTDAAGCIYEQSFEITEPTALRPEYLTSSPICVGDATGNIQINSIEGGILPIGVSINGSALTDITSYPYVINNLADGEYELIFMDANGCENILNLTIVPASPLVVDLGPDQNLEYGESTVLEALVNSTSIDSFFWSPQTYLLAPNALITEAEPLNSIVYEFWVRDLAGCVASDALQINVQRVDRVYIPNVFSPDGNGQNDVFTLFAGQQVINVRSMRIYDRWGELLFEKLDIQPNDETAGWDGYTRGKQVMPGVYVYVVEIEYFDGNSEVFEGDVTVVR